MTDWLWLLEKLGFPLIVAFVSWLLGRGGRQEFKRTVVLLVVALVVPPLIRTIAARARDSARLREWAELTADVGTNDSATVTERAEVTKTPAGEAAVPREPENASQ